MLPKKLKILVAEDGKVNVMVVTDLLKSLGLEATYVGDGVEALEELKKSQYDIVLMDCHMPIMDGFEAATKIQEINEIKRPYIIALTASAMQKDIDKCYASGMDYFLSKPVSKNTLLRALSEYQLNRKR